MSISLRFTLADIFTYLGIAAEVARGDWVGRREGGGRGYGGERTVRTSTSSTSTAALLSSSLILTGPASPEDPAPQGGRAAGGAAWRVTGCTGDKKRQEKKQNVQMRGEERKPLHISLLDLPSESFMSCYEEKLQAFLI